MKQKSEISFFKYNKLLEMKKYFLGAFVALVFGAAIVNMSITSHKGTNLSVVALANIKALATEPEASCIFDYVTKRQSTNILHCEGEGSLCCTMN
jgi:hypothetical protein